MKILIVEDSEEIAEGLKFSLERKKFSVDTVIILIMLKRK